MEAKVFTGSPNEVEKKINKWLQENDNIEVVSLTQSALIPSPTAFMTIAITILYNQL